MAPIPTIREATPLSPTGSVDSSASGPGGRFRPHPRHSLSTPSSRLSSPYLEVRSKTENLDRLISDLDREDAAGGGSDGGGQKTSGGAREVRKYVRRRYTEELPDVRLEENMSVQYPPIRKQQQRAAAAAAAVVRAKNSN